MQEWLSLDKTRHARCTEHFSALIVFWRRVLSAYIGLHTLLAERADRCRPVRVGLIGAGKFGSMVYPFDTKGRRIGPGLWRVDPIAAAFLTRRAAGGWLGQQPGQIAQRVRGQYPRPRPGWRRVIYAVRRRTRPVVMSLPLAVTAPSPLPSSRRPPCPDASAPEADLSRDRQMPLRHGPAHHQAHSPKTVCRDAAAGRRIGMTKPDQKRAAQLSRHRSLTDRQRLAAVEPDDYDLCADRLGGSFLV